MDHKETIARLRAAKAAMERKGCLANAVSAFSLALHDIPERHYLPTNFSLERKDGTMEFYSRPRVIATGNPEHPYDTVLERTSGGKTTLRALRTGEFAIEAATDILAFVEAGIENEQKREQERKADAARRKTIAESDRR